VLRQICPVPCTCVRPLSLQNCSITSHLHSSRALRRTQSAAVPLPTDFPLLQLGIHLTPLGTMTPQKPSDGKLADLGKASQETDLDGHNLPPTPATSSPRSGRKYALATELVYTEGNDQHNASSMPIYQVGIYKTELPFMSVRVFRESLLIVRSSPPLSKAVLVKNMTTLGQGTRHAHIWSDTLPKS